MEVLEQQLCRRQPHPQGKVEQIYSIMQTKTRDQQNEKMMTLEVTFGPARQTGPRRSSRSPEVATISRLLRRDEAQISEYRLLQLNFLLTVRVAGDLRLCRMSRRKLTAGMYPSAMLHHPVIHDARAEKAKDERRKPLPGFYRQILIKTWPVFFHKESSMLFLAFLAALIVFRFFLTNIDLSAVLLDLLGWLRSAGSCISTWGCQIWYCLETIPKTHHQWATSFRPISARGSNQFGNMMKTWYLFLVAVILVEVPFLLLAGWLEKAHIGPPWLWHIITLAVLSCCRWPR